MKRHLLTIAALFLFAITATPVLADYQSPTFPSCTNPQGTVIAHYDSGLHAIPGADQSVAGSDTVYGLDENLNMVMQCFCPPVPQTTGTQTNWLSIANVSEEQKQSLEQNGWMYIESGASAGLANISYLAQNSKFACNASPQQQETPTPTPTVCLTPTPSTSSEQILAPIATQAAAIETPSPSAGSPTETVSQVPLTAQIQAANETNTPSSTSSNNAPTSSGNSSPAPSNQTSNSPTTLPNTGGSEEVIGTLLFGISSLGISFLLKKIAA